MIGIAKKVTKMVKSNKYLSKGLMYVFIEPHFYKFRKQKYPVIFGQTLKVSGHSGAFVL